MEFRKYYLYKIQNRINSCNAYIKKLCETIYIIQGTVYIKK